FRIGGLVPFGVKRPLPTFSPGRRGRVCKTQVFRNCANTLPFLHPDQGHAASRPPPPLAGNRRAASKNRTPKTRVAPAQWNRSPRREFRANGPERPTRAETPPVGGRDRNHAPRARHIGVAHQ